MPRRGPRRIGLCDERCAPIGWHEREDRVLVVRGIAGEIGTRGHLLQKAACEDGDVYVRSLQLSVRARNTARLHGFEHARTVGAGFEPPKAGEVGIVLLSLRVLGMVVGTVRVGLPDLDHRVTWSRCALTVCDAER